MELRFDLAADCFSGILAEAEIPGGALAIVQHEEVQVLHATGLAQIAPKLAMTTETPFAIGSTTKSFNATLLAALVDDGLVDWDAPVSSYLPAFNLADKATSHLVTVRDLVAMRTGLPRHDWVWFESTLDAAGLATKIGMLELSEPFRTRFQYNNLTTILSAHIAEVVTGRAWSDLILDRILRPLEMEETRVRDGVPAGAAQGHHHDFARRLVETRHFQTDLAGPAGTAIVSTIRDMSKWIGFNVSGTKSDGNRLISEAAFTALRTPQIPVNGGLAGVSPLACYGLGWTVDFYRSFRTVSHSGYIWDISSDVLLVPDLQLGLVCFHNHGPILRAKAINEAILDQICGLAAKPVVAEALGSYETKVQAHADSVRSRRPIAGTFPSHELTSYVGTYGHETYGTISIILKEGKLILERGSFQLPLIHWHYDYWIGAPTDTFGIHVPFTFDNGSPLAFATGSDGSIDSVALRLEPNGRSIVFARIQADSSGSNG